MYCTQCISRQVLLMCTQGLGWGFVRPGRTHTHGCLHSHATCLTPHTLVHCRYSTHRHGWEYTFGVRHVAWECRHPCVCVRPGRTNPQSRCCVHISNT